MDDRADLLVIGAGGLGTPAAWAAAAAGVRSLIVCDDDVVDVTNLHRQVLFTDADLGTPKAAALTRALVARYPVLRAEAVALRFDAASADALIGRARVVLDGSDNLATKFLANDACVRTGTPLVHGAALGLGGQWMAIAAAGRPCYRCLFEELPPDGTADSCAEAGILGPVAGVIGARMAGAALAFLGGVGAEHTGKLVRFDAPDHFRTIRFRPNPMCRACAPREHQLSGRK